MESLRITDHFIDRHLGPGAKDLQQMLEAIGVSSIDQLINETIPASIRQEEPLDLPEAISEYEYLQELRKIASKNKVFKNYIGQGYSETIVPAVIRRNILENPGWYTQYTPYQAEISQGRLEALLNFQTMVSDLTGLPLANASLLDEGTAAAEAMIMLFNDKNKRVKNEPINKLLVSDELLDQTIDILKTRSTPLGIEVEVMPTDQFDLSDEKYLGLCFNIRASSVRSMTQQNFAQQQPKKGSILPFVPTCCL